jgi:DNA-binding YbaB/EbfC family protein
MKVRLPKNNANSMDNIRDLAKKAQQAQEKMDLASKELESKEYSATAGGSFVKVVVSGKPEVKSIEIDPSVIDSGDVEMLTDMVIAAVNEAIRKAFAEKDNVMQELSAQISFPGLG